MDRSIENVIEFLNSENEAMLTLSKQRYISRVKKLKESHPNEVSITENVDGTIFAKVPVRWIKISPTRAVSEEQRQAAADRFAQMRRAASTECSES